MIKRWPLKTFSSPNMDIPKIKGKKKYFFYSILVPDGLYVVKESCPQKILISLSEVSLLKGNYKILINPVRTGVYLLQN